MPCTALVYNQDHTNIDAYKNAGMPKRGDICRIEDAGFAFGTLELDTNKFLRVTILDRTKTEMIDTKAKRYINIYVTPQAERRYRIPRSLCDIIEGLGGSASMNMADLVIEDKGI